MEGALSQMNIGYETNPKLIYISDIIPPKEKAELIDLVKEYINVFV